MSCTLRTRVTGMAAAGLFLLSAGLASAADTAVSFKKRDKDEKAFATAVGKAIVLAAHKTAQRPGLVSYKVEHPKEGRTDLKLKMEFYGKVTKKKYIADIVVKIDSTNKDAWEALNIEYSDNDNIPANLKKIQALVKQFNK